MQHSIKAVAKQRLQEYVRFYNLILLIVVKSKFLFRFTDILWWLTLIFSFDRLFVIIIEIIRNVRKYFLHFWNDFTVCERCVNINGYSTTYYSSSFKHISCRKLGRNLKIPHSFLLHKISSYWIYFYNYIFWLLIVIVKSQIPVVKDRFPSMILI